MTVLCLMGPTAMGKTEAALALADRFPIDIISVDSPGYRHGETGRGHVAALSARPGRYL